MTPMMQQYKEIKSKHEDCILFFRLGDFYEMFFEDAVTASRELELTLTGRNYDEGKAPMCGVPYHSVEPYLGKLIKKGYKVAICEQMEDPATAKGLVERQVIRIVTPGTITTDILLDEQENNYLVSVYISEKTAGLAYCDISTGELSGCEVLSVWESSILNEIVRVKAREILVNPYADETGFSVAIAKTLSVHLNVLPAEQYGSKISKKIIFDHFGVISLKGLGLEGKTGLTHALSGLLIYLNDTQKQTLRHIQKINIYELGSRMALDKSSLRNLEISETVYEQQKEGSLFGVLDRSKTAMGKRMLKRWLREPLNNPVQIRHRLDAVDYFYSEILTRNNVREHLNGMYDLERLTGKLSCGNANCRDLIALRNSLRVLPELKGELISCSDDYIRELCGAIPDLSAVEQLISAGITEDPPPILKEGGLIKNGYSKQLDELKLSIADGQQWISSLENLERSRTGIKNLKVGFNKVFGYYLEVTKSNYSLVPFEYTRKQTLANCERYITPELKEVETVVLGAEAKINQLEYDLFIDLRNTLMESVSEMLAASDAVAKIDVLASNAETASKLGYVKPEINEGSVIAIDKGRHPVIEHSVTDGNFVSNDVWIDNDKQSFLLITGPNMAGKSTYMRQVALIVLMAQAGSFVPAERAIIGVVDRIYTRIGASDNLAQGQSTFYVEMSELAYILNTATGKSLIILDEIGRGTSTYDGLSIAWALTEHLCGKRRVRTMFATHYHELTTLEDTLPGLKNLNVEVSDDGDEVIFLYKIMEGSASGSYGIHVAQLAGVPKAVLERAADKLSDLEIRREDEGIREPAFGSGDLTGENRDAFSYKSDGINESMIGEQLSLFSFVPNPVLDRLKALDLMEITPSKAFSILEELKKAAEEC